MCGCLSLAPYWGPNLARTQACALTRNQTSDPLVHRPVINPLSHTSQGYALLFLFYKAYYMCPIYPFSISNISEIIPHQHIWSVFILMAIKQYHCKDVSFLLHYKQCHREHPFHISSYTWGNKCFPSCDMAKPKNRQISIVILILPFQRLYLLFSHHTLMSTVRENAYSPKLYYDSKIFCVFSSLLNEKNSILSFYFLIIL